LRALLLCMTVDATAAKVDATDAALSDEKKIDVPALLAKVSKLDELAKQLDEVRADNAKYREEKRALKAKKEEAARVAGDLKPLLAAREADIEKMRADLEALKPLAERAKTLDRQRAERIAEKAKALSDEDRAVVDAIADIDTREKLVDRLSKETEKPKEPVKTSPRSVSLEKKSEDAPAKTHFRAFGF
jgi:DNA repair exonuclease SbcCD ATPase subunit